MRARGAQMDAEARLARAAKAEALGRMAGEVAHDFNNVLLVIAANLELARGELDRHPAISYLDDALEAAKSATARTRQGLASSHDQPLSRRAVLRRPAVGGACRQGRPGADQRRDDAPHWLQLATRVS